MLVTLELSSLPGAAPFRRLLQYCCVSLNNSGTVAFSADLDTGGEGIFTGSGGPTTTISDNRTHFIPIVINDSGTVAFTAFGAGGGIFMGSGAPITTIADSSGPFASITLFPSLNDSGTVAFGASLDAGGEGIFTSSDGLITTIADSSGPFHSFVPHLFPEVPFISLNDAGTVAFAASLDAGGDGILTSSDGLITTIADSSGPFAAFFAETLINDSGMVAFFGSLDSGGFGIFTGPDPVADEVIRLGDRLFGSTLTRLIMAPDGLNNSGQIAFFYFLDDGHSGIALANPRAIPEPGSLALVGLGLGASA